MFKVTFINLGPDLRSAQADFAPMSFTDVSEAQITAALEVFRQIDPVQNAAAEPHIIIESSGAKLLVRTGQGKLFVYNARDLSEPFSELDPAGVIRQLAPSGAIGETPSDPSAPSATPAQRHRRGTWLALTIIALALALDGYSVFGLLRTRSAVPSPSVAFLADPSVIEGVRHSAAGRYATGAEPGDRAIEIAADGHVRFLRLTAGGERTVGHDSYRIAKHGDATCLVTSAGRLIEIQNIYTISYSRDTYHRAR